MSRKRLPDYRDRFVCLARLRPRPALEEEVDRFCLRCTRCEKIFFVYEGSGPFRCLQCRMKTPEDMVPVPKGYGYILAKFKGYAPGGKPPKASQAEGPRA